MDPATLPLYLRMVPEVLEVLLICFEAAADAAIPIIIAYAEQLPTVNGRERWRIYRTQDLSNPPADVLSIPFPPPKIIAGLARYNMCDAFAFVLEEEANKLMRRLFDGEARWILTMPRPASTLSLADDLSPDIFPVHSVLYIKLPNGDHLIMDGTPEQMGWERETWLLPARIWAGERLGGQDGSRGRWHLVEDDDKIDTREELKTADGGYWLFVEEKMQELFRELRWNELLEMTHEDRVRMVKEQATCKFSGAWDEAMERR